MITALVEIVLILVLIVANGIFSGSEIAVVSARKIRLEQLAEQGNGQARAALRLANAPNDFLSAVQIGITLIGILSGAVGGATLARRLEPVIDSIPLLRAWSEGLSVAVVVGVITYLSLVIGELLPKRIALNNPEAVACAVARPMRWLARWTAPLVQLLGASTDLLLNLLGVHSSSEPDLTEEEIKALVRQGAESGVLDEAEHDMVQRVFRLGDRSIRALMTPRTEICWLDLNTTREQQLKLVTDSNYSRLPVAHGNLDDCIGILRGRNLLASALDGGAVDLKALLQPPLYITESARALNVIEQFRQTGVHIALVTDEYGGIEGLVTLTDLMEAIVGDLPSAEDLDEPQIIRREDGSWLLDGALDISEFKDLLQRTSLPDEASGSFHTLGGFVLHVLGRVPRAGDHFNWDDLRFEVMDMDGKRIDKVLVEAQPQSPGQAS
ncbi:MAG: hemolysin family protein [Synechococcaceae cyanobacterium ELA739]